MSIYSNEMVVYLSFTAAGLELMAGTRGLDGDIKSIFRDLAAMRIFHMGAISQVMRGIKPGEGSSWPYGKWFETFAYPGMELSDVIPAVEKLKEMDDFAINSHYLDPNQIASHFIEAKKSLETQRMILNTIQASLEDTDQKGSYICRHCGNEFKGVVWREGQDADKCQVCGANASALRARANWKIYI